MVPDTGDRTPRDPDAPDYDIEIEADDLLTDLAEGAAEYGEDYEEKRSWWQDSFDMATEFHEARYWMLEARGGQRAYSESIAKIQPSGRFRNDDGTVDVREYMAWLSTRSQNAHERRSHGFDRNPQADEEESAFARILSLLRDDYGVGWPRLDDIGGNPIEVDLP